ncbi:hypothetical protein AYI68_g1980 [Smittium mucronatum]|uniref:Uncharacterized protein n=1 Tax=Smittium mucronatum TaxID=133383 RepID=A0A1R0H418_9FUNG|nr:hypothetical protein AYI68_g1980 [Smittium mucronatum]
MCKFELKGWQSSVFNYSSIEGDEEFKIKSPDNISSFEECLKLEAELEIRMVEEMKISVYLAKECYKILEIWSENSERSMADFIQMMGSIQNAATCPNCDFRNPQNLYRCINHGESTINDRFVLKMVLIDITSKVFYLKLN